MTFTLAFLILPDWVPFVGGAIVLIAAIVAVNSFLERRRKRALTDVALQIGFNYEGEDWVDQERAPHLETPLFDKGHNQEFLNVMTGSVSGFQTSLFDYKFVIGGGKSSQTCMQTVVSFTKPGISMPEFELQPEGIMQKIGAVFVHDDIDFDSHPEFSRRMQLRSPEEEKTRELFNPSLLTFLEGLDQSKKWRLEGVTETLLIYRWKKRVKPEDFRQFFEETSAIASQFFGLASLRKTTINQQ